MALCSVGIAGMMMVTMALFTRALLSRRRAYAGAGCSRRGMHGPGRHPFLRALFHRLDTTPGQEREIRSALDELGTVARESRRSAWGAREGVARAVTGDAFDPSAFDEAFGVIASEGTRFKDAARGALEKVHAVLDDKQRKALADLLARGRRGFGRGGAGPYRA